MRAYPAIGAFVGREHRFPVRVYYEDTDFSGFVYHANYLKFFERGRSDGLHAAGVSHTDLLAWDPPATMVVRHMSIDFVRPAVVEDDLTVLTHFEGLRGARMFARQTIVRGEEILASARLEIAMIGLDGRPRKIPKDFIALFEPWLDPPAP